MGCVVIRIYRVDKLNGHFQCGSNVDVCIYQLNILTLVLPHVYLA